MKYTDTVALKEIQTEDGTVIPNKRAVVNVDENNRVLGIVSPKYKIIPNTKLLDSITPVLDDLGLNVDKPDIRTTKGGAITFFKFMTETITGEIQKGDIVRFGCEFFNSYDGSMPVGFHIIAERLVCTNGLIVPKSITEIHIRHTGSANTNEIKNRLKEYYPKTQSAIGLWKDWVDIKPPENRLQNFLKQSVSKKLQRDFLNKYKTLPSNKQNLWEFYNLITYYISHQLKTRKEELKAYRQFNTNEVLTNRLARIFNKKEDSYETENIL